VSARNHLRVPAVLSGLLFLVYVPLILRLGPSTYRAATGSEPADYLARWLFVTAMLFAVSLIAYAIRVGRASRSTRAE
jgi:hypothetical protein